MNLNRFNKPRQRDCASITEFTRDRSDRSSRILIVEDNDLVRAAVTLRLTSLGYTVVGASNADEAIAALTVDNAFDYLLADIMLTGPITGTMLANHVRDRWANVRILLMTGYQEFALPESGRAGGFPLLLKPFATYDLVHTLDRLKAA